MKISKILFMLLLIFLVIGCGQSDNIGKLETGPETSCNTDEDCWCQIFDGSKFLEGKGGSKCCTREFALSRSNSCPAVDHCMKCLYR